MKKVLLSLLCLFPILIFSQNGRQVINFNSDWQFSNQEDFADSQTIEPNNNDFSFSGWKSVTLPHTAKIEPLVVKEPWVGVSWYKKDFKADKEWKNKKVFVEFEAVMQKADIWLNGKYLLTHYGGYLPFTIDISNDILFDKTNRIVVKTDNTDNAEIPPGKPIDKLDFCYYSGIYRNVSIIVTNGLHITDAVEANLPASGGLRIWFPKVSAQSATIAVSTNIRNDSETQKKFSLTYKLFNKSGKLIETISSKEQSLEANKAADMLQNIEVTNPQLWHPDHPDLYTLEVTINENKKITDMVETKLGIRKFEILKDRFLLNDEPLLLVGTNRHQEYPYIGNALSDNAQYRDA
ncbi:MAG: sugar-binding domain-containing protein, partial [Paludibacter sp.]